MNNQENKETLESLWAYCASNNRLIPKKWNDFYNLLKDKKQKSSGGWEPPLPLILGAWWNTIPIQKQSRFKEHVQWAFDHGQIDKIGNYLRGLKENEWFHFGDPDVPDGSVNTYPEATDLE